VVASRSWPSKFLNGAQVGAFFQHVRAEGVAQRVRMDLGGKAFGDGNFLDDAPTLRVVSRPPRRLISRACLLAGCFGTTWRGQIPFERRSSPNHRTERSVLFSPCRG
jgi:hypothetical protein